MEKPPVMEKDLVNYWKERCECPCNGIDDARRCRCGAAKKAGLICEVCEGELVQRNSTYTTRPFWGCSRYSTIGCEYTRPFKAGRSDEFIPLTPKKHQTTTSTLGPSSAKKARFVTPYRSTTTTVSSNTTNNTTTRRCLFPEITSIQLTETFIGPELAVELQNHGFPSSLLKKDSYNDIECASSSKWVYGEKRNQEEIFCYYYKTNRNSKRLNHNNSETLRNDNTQKPIVLDLFAGAGGMSLGLQNAGFYVKYAVEHDKTCCDTLGYNNKDMIIFHQGVQEFLNYSDVDNNDNNNNTICYPYQIDHIHASSPCGDFSHARSIPIQGETNIKNLTLLFPKALKRFMPKTASFENVKGILQGENKRYIQKVVSELLKIDYQVRVLLLNASNYNVPQNRQRVFILAAQKGLQLPKIPKASLNTYTVSQALQSLESINPINYDGPVLINGNIVYDHRIEPYKITKYEPELLQKNSFCNAVRRQNCILHYNNNNREITVRERARLQCYPDWYRFCGTPIQQIDQIGNSVPVNLAEAVGRSIMASYK